MRVLSWCIGNEWAITRVYHTLDLIKRKLDMEEAELERTELAKIYCPRSLRVGLPDHCGVMGNPSIDGFWPDYEIRL